MSSIQYKRVAAGFYTDAKITQFGIQEPHPTTFLLWLISGPVFGVLPSCASIGRYGISEQSGWEPEEVDWMMEELVSAGIAQFDPAAPFLYLPQAIKYNPPRSPLNVTSWQSDWRKLPNCFLKGRAYSALKGHCELRDKDSVFDKKRPRTAKNSFVRAFGSIDKPPEPPMVPTIEEQKHSSTKQVELKRKRNRKRYRNSVPSTPEASTPHSNIRNIDFSGDRGDS